MGELALQFDLDAIEIAQLASNLRRNPRQSDDDVGCAIEHGLTGADIVTAKDQRYGIRHRGRWLCRKQE
jgi:hypothetical protein